ncbi:DUF2283 domain-containing protein [Bremerella sp. T1]|uniref:DUF2283 domain-containing protein n=1 Tax=Bremerella sp. TYQ1 TaxID=3119568 RepID=UPI001CCA93CB|nr:DUF2283 domain-containing protein [Bremerella volcania]UBM38160.1 DUF2283 domain-containing protein [Bremerella volcania]
MTKKPKKYLQLRTHEEGLSAAYLELADHPHELVSGLVKKTVQVHQLIPEYDGPGLAIDFDAEGKAIGIEILYPHDEFYSDKLGDD